MPVSEDVEQLAAQCSQLSIGRRIGGSVDLALLDAANALRAQSAEIARLRFAIQEAHDLIAPVAREHVRQMDRYDEAHGRRMPRKVTNEMKAADLLDRALGRCE